MKCAVHHHFDTSAVKGDHYSWHIYHLLVGVKMLVKVQGGIQEGEKRETRFKKKDSVKKERLLLRWNDVCSLSASLLRTSSRLIAKMTLLGS